MSDMWIFLGLLVTAGMPVLLAWQANRARRQERKDDNARQDEIAARVKEAAAAAKEVSTTLAAATLTTNAKLEDIHILVNSALTAAKQAAYDAVASSLVLMREMVRRDRAAASLAGRPYEEDADARASIEATEAKLASMGDELAERKEATRVVAISNMNR